MIRTQIQLPDELYRASKELAERKEWSLAELVRRGLEGLLTRYPEPPAKASEWNLPDARPLGGDAFFAQPDWRYDIHQERGMVREAKPSYSSSKKKRS